jgi:hypothetical protein
MRGWPFLVERLKISRLQVGKLCFGQKLSKTQTRRSRILSIAKIILKSQFRQSGVLGKNCPKQKSRNWRERLVPVVGKAFSEKNLTLTIGLRNNLGLSLASERKGHCSSEWYSETGGSPFVGRQATPGMASRRVGTTSESHTIICSSAHLPVCSSECNSIFARPVQPGKFSFHLTSNQP